MRIGKLLLVVAILAMSAALSACSSEQAQEPVAPKAPSEQQAQDGGPADKTLTVTVPKMQRVKDAPMPDSTGDDEEVLKNYAGVHLEGTGFPWQEQSNVYLAGHRLGYPGYPSFLAFYDLDKVKTGDQIFIKDANGKQYTYEVFKTFEVDPTDLYVTEPINGRNVVTLQSCTLPDYAKRVIVQAELKNSS